MTRIVDLIAPKSVFGWVFIPLLFVAAIFVVNVAVRLILFGTMLYELWFIAVMVALVSLPFILPVLALIAHMHRLQMQLAELAATDMLTGLPNRRAFLDAARSSPPQGECDALLMIDVDHFKRINDTYGHVVGDLCLQELARILRGLVRRSDIIARMGGEEFAALLRGVDADEARQIADRIARGARFVPEPDAEPMTVTTSVGIARLCPGTSLEEVMQLADQALYAAKEEGRARSRTKDTPLTARIDPYVQNSTASAAQAG